MNKEEQHFNRERFKQEAALGIFNLMEEQGMSREALAKAVGRSHAFISKVLSGSHNLTLETLADLYAALGRAVHLRLAQEFGQVVIPD